MASCYEGYSPDRVAMMKREVEALAAKQAKEMFNEAVSQIDLRKWAIEQAIKCGASGEWVVDTAERILNYVEARQNDG